MNKSKFFIYLLAVLITVACVSFFTACSEDNGPSGDLTEKTYFSNTTGANRKCNVYTPPGYNPDETYPVMYLLHGIGGDHNEWKDNGTPKEILNNLINSGDAKPMIVVMPNCRAIINGSDSASGNPYREEAIQGFYDFKDDLKNDLMPFIKENYNILEGRNNTAIAGLSMGGMDSIYIMVKMPELFGYVGHFSASPGMPQGTTLTLPDEYKNNTFIFGICGLQDDIALGTSKSYNQQLNDNGIKTEYYNINGGHGWDVWKRGLSDFAKSIFK